MALYDAPAIEKVDHHDNAVCRRLMDWLAPHEPHALFLLGNLAGGYAGSHVYVAQRGDDIVGVGAYYERPKSVSLYAVDDASAAGLTRFIAGRHPRVDFVNAIGPVGFPAARAMVELGYEPDDDPRQLFMEAALPPAGLARVPHEKKARFLEPRDAEAAALLMRHLQRPGDTSPVSQAELDRIVPNKHRMVLEADGQVVATATTNGVGVRAFQILGVVTDPNHRGHGYARAVCAALIRRMQGFGAEHAVLFTGPENVAAQRCYAGLGFSVTGEYCMAKFKPLGSTGKN